MHSSDSVSSTFMQVGKFLQYVSTFIGGFVIAFCPRDVILAIMIDMAAPATTSRGIEDNLSLIHI